MTGIVSKFGSRREVAEEDIRALRHRDGSCLSDFKIFQSATYLAIHVRIPAKQMVPAPAPEALSRLRQNDFTSSGISLAAYIHRGSRSRSNLMTSRNHVRTSSP